MHAEHSGAASRGVRTHVRLGVCVCVCKGHIILFLILILTLCGHIQKPLPSVDRKKWNLGFI